MLGCAPDGQRRVAAGNRILTSAISRGIRTHMTANPPLIPGRTCPLEYRYGAGALAQPATLHTDSLWIAGGLYGNTFASGEAEDRHRRGRGARALQGHARGDHRQHRGARVLLLGAAQRGAAAARRRQGGGARGVERPALEPVAERAHTVAEQGYPGFDYTLWVGLGGRHQAPVRLSGSRSPLTPTSGLSPGRRARRRPSRPRAPANRRAARASRRSPPSGRSAARCA